MPFEISKHSELSAIRDIRNSSVGHPTRKDRPKRDPVSYHFISRPTLSRAGFQLLSSNEHGSNVFSTVDVVALIVDQRSKLTGILRAVVDELQRREAEHKAEFRVEKLVHSFPHTLLYSFQKLDEAIRGTGPRGLGEWALDEVERSMSAFQEALARRGYATDDMGPLGDAYEELTYPIEQLRRYLRFEDSDIATDKLALIAADFIQSRLEELKAIALEIDEEYVDES